jgi:hypothetical protein
MVPQITTPIENMLGSHQWMPSTLELAFNQLAGEAQSYLRDSDAPLPAFREPWAGRRLLERLVELRQRNRAIAVSPQVQESELFRQRAEASWGQYLSDLETMRTELRSRQNADMYFEYLGLGAGDLGEPTDPENPEARKFEGKRAGWPDIASRLRAAVTKWQAVRPENRWTIPLIVSINRQARAIDEQGKQIASLSEQVAKLEKIVSKLGETQ